MSKDKNISLKLSDNIQIALFISLALTSRLIVDSISSSEDYTTIKKVFHISLLYFSWGNMKKPLYHGKTIIREIDSEHLIDLHIADQGGIIYDATHILPEYFLISVPLFDDVITKEIDEWLYVMKHSEVKEDFKSPYMKKVAERLSILKMNAEEKAAYYTYLKETLTQRDVITAAEEKGIEKGEARAKIEIAKNLLAQGVNMSIISAATGLDEEEIRKLVH